MIKSKMTAVKLFGACLDVMLKNESYLQGIKMNELHPQKNILISIRGIFITLGVTSTCNCKAEQNQKNPGISFGHISPKRLEISGKNILVILVFVCFEAKQCMLHDYNTM